MMKAKFKRMMAVLMALAMVVTGMYFMPQTSVTTKADEPATEETTESESVAGESTTEDEWTSIPGDSGVSFRQSWGGGGSTGITQGIWHLWDIDSAEKQSPSNPYYDGSLNYYDGAISYKGSGATLQDMTLRIDEPAVFTPGATYVNVLGMETSFQLDKNVIYQFTVKYTSTNAGGAGIGFGTKDGSNALDSMILSHQAVAGENVIKGYIKNERTTNNINTVPFYFYPSDGTSALPAGTEINITEVSFTRLPEINNPRIEGQCGNNMHWRLNRATGFLDVYGNGRYSCSESPWGNQNQYVQTVSCSADITKIVYNAFNSCSNMTDIYIYNEECNIFDSAYTIPAGATIHGYAGSTAQAYAENYNKTFVEIGANDEPVTDLPVYEPETESGWTAVPGYSRSFSSSYVNGLAGNTTQGVWRLYNMNSFTGYSGDTTYYLGEISYRGDGDSYDDLTLRIDEPVTFQPRAYGYHPIGMSTSFSITEKKLYKYTIKFTSTKAGAATIFFNTYSSQNAQYAPFISHQVVAGENIMTGFTSLDYEEGNSSNSVDFCFYPTDGTTALPAGTKINFSEISFEGYENIDDEDMVLQGQCGENVYWSFNRASSCLEITGTGAMDSYSILGNGEQAPWYYLRHHIRTVKISEGVTNIGNNVFYRFNSLRKVYIYNDDCSVSGIPSNVTIYGYANSTAQTYAETNERDFVVIDDNESTTVDPGDGWTPVPQSVKQNGFFTEAGRTQVGNLYLCAEKFNGAMSYKGGDVQTGNLKIKIDTETNITHTYQGNPQTGLLVQAPYSLVNGKTYRIRIRVKSTHAGTLLITYLKGMGPNYTIDGTLAAGDNTFTETFEAYSTMEGIGLSMYILDDIPAGAILEFEEVSVEEVVGETTTAEPTTDDGWIPVTPGQAGQYDPIIYVTPVVVGQWSLYAKDGYGAMSYQGSGTTASDMKLRIESCTTASLAARTYYYMESGKTYNYTARFTSTNAGEANVNLYYAMGPPVSVNTITAGENVITGTFTCGYTGNNSFEIYPSNLPAGTIIDIEELSIEEVVDETTTEEPTTAEPVTEEPTTEDPGPEADFKIASKTLALSSGISLVFKVNKSLFENRYSEPKIVVLLDGIETEITEYTDEGSRYAFEFTKITPDKMNVMVEATLHASKNGKEYVSPVVEYSVATYAYNMLNKYGETAGMETFRTLIVDLLNYGAASQNYTGFNTDNLANADLTATQRSWATGDLGALTSVKNNKYVTIDNPSVLWKSAGLALQDAVIVRMKIQADSTDGLVVQVRDDYGTTWNIEPEDFELAAGTENQYYISFKGFNVGRMSESMYFTVLRNGVAVSNTYRYSVESYVLQYMNNDGPLGALVVAMMKYGKSAQAYSS